MLLLFFYHFRKVSQFWNLRKKYHKKQQNQNQNANRDRAEANRNREEIAQEIDFIGNQIQNKIQLIIKLKPITNKIKTHYMWELAYWHFLSKILKYTLYRYD